MIIIEGPDGSGKSTIVSKLSEEFDLPVQHSQGPPKSDHEFHDRIERYLALPALTIFDRHPLISGPIYDAARGRRSCITRYQMIDFYSRPKLVLIASPSNPGVLPHIVKAYDSPEHLKLIEEKQAKINSMYRAYSKCPDFHSVDPLGPFMIIRGFVQDFIERMK